MKINLVTLASGLAVSIALCTAETCFADTLNTVLAENTKLSDAAKNSQETIDALYHETTTLTRRYRETLRKTANLKIFNEQLKTQISSEQEEMTSIEKQLEDVAETQREIIPLMKRMVDTLRQFVSLDLPFLLKERKERITKLDSSISRADITISEKYRRILEAYQIENDYGRTIESYQGELSSVEAGKAKQRIVTFLRVGRVALFYLTLNGEESGYFEQKTKKWNVISDSSKNSVKRGILIAKRQAPPGLLVLPVSSPEHEK